MTGHDRLLAGLQLLVRGNRTVVEYETMARRLIRLDTEPLPNETT